MESHAETLSWRGRSIKHNWRKGMVQAMDADEYIEARVASAVNAVTINLHAQRRDAIFLKNQDRAFKHHPYHRLFFRDRF